MRLIHSHQVTPLPRDENVAALIETVDESELRAWVERLAVPRHFTAESEQNARTAELLLAELGQLGFKCARQGDCSNIIAMPASPFEEVVLVAAHFDSVPRSPGADDNASALAALLVAASRCSRLSPAAPVIFACFNREEDGFLGSADFVEDHLRSARFRIRTAHVLEMIGYASHEHGSQKLPTGLPIQLSDRGDFLGLLANDISAHEMNLAIQCATTYTPDLPATGLQVVAGVERVFPVLARSDHVPFWRVQVPAVMWTDTAEFRNPNYHQPSDRPESLDYSFLRKVTMLLLASILTRPD